MSETELISFVLRFTQEYPAAGQQALSARWRGTLRHVQTNEELHFTHISEALAFISRYVKLEPSITFTPKKS